MVVRNANGEKHILGVAKTVKEAGNQAATIEQDFKTLSTAAWCDRYNVPTSFLSGPN